MKAYTVQQAAEILQVCPDTVKKEIKRNRLKGMKVGTEWRITEQALADYMGLVANNYKTELEAKLEAENERLKRELARIQDKLLKIRNELIEA